MAGVPARAVFADLLSGVFPGSPASGSDKEEARIALIARIELSRDGTFGSSQSRSQTIEVWNQRVSGVAARSSVLSA